MSAPCAYARQSLPLPFFHNLNCTVLFPINRVLRLRHYLFNSKSYDKKKSNDKGGKNSVSELVRQYREARSLYSNSFDEYQKKVNKLDRQIEPLESEKKKLRERKTAQVEKLLPKFEEVDRILTILAIDSKRNLELSKKDVSCSYGKYLEDLGYLRNGKYLKIRVFISENRSPVSRYSLSALGCCLFKDILDISLPSVWNVPVQFKYSIGKKTDLTVVLKRAADPDTLKKYLERNKDKMLTDVISACEKTEEEYESVCSNYVLDDFRELFEFECKHCGYFLTRDSRSNYYLEKGQCPKCYKSVA